MKLRVLSPICLVTLLLASCVTAPYAPSANKAPENIIVVIGDGMGVSTVTAIRIYAGQLEGASGEEHVLPWETFPNVALAKTYNTNQQVPDSAGTATAIFTGRKTKAGVISIGPEARRADCASGAGRRLETVFERAAAKGLAAGVVTTARITHATPAATYAHAAERDWESDQDMPAKATLECKDIADQLIAALSNGTIDVALGGGRRSFRPENRRDGRNLVSEWAASREKNVFWEKSGDLSSALRGGEAVLGLFSESHMAYELDRPGGAGGEPSLAEMTRAAINHLSKDDNGYILLIEAGRIDHGHHAGNAARALHDGVALAEAAALADAMTSDEDTLIIVTADHSHTFTIGGYPTRGNPILGNVVGNDDHGAPSTSPTLAADGMPFTTLAYANGPGAREGARADLAGVDTTDAEFKQQARVPLHSETHGGEDVAVYAKGPGADHIFGVMEQNEILKWYLDRLH